MSNLTGFAAIRRTMENRTYRVFTTGNVVSNIGTWVQRTGVQWLTWEITGSGAWLGIVAFADLFPTLVLAPLTGAIADRVDRRRAMLITQSLMLIQAVVMAVMTLTGVMTIEWLIGLVAFGGAVMSFNQPVRLAVIPSLVPRDDLTAAIGINSLIFNMARFVGPPVAGFLIVFSGTGSTFAFNAVSYLAFVMALLAIRIDPHPRGSGGREIGNIPREIAEGYGYAARHPGIGPLLVILTFISICARPYIELLPGFAADVFGRGAEGLGWLQSMVGLGAMLGGLWLAQRGVVKGLTSVAVAAVAVLSCALIAFTITDIFWVALPCLVVTGFGMIVIGVGEQTLIQNAVDPTVRGRVMGLYGMIGRGAPAFGALIMGGLSSYVGFRWPVAGGAIMCLGIWVWANQRKHALARELEHDPAK